MSDVSEKSGNSEEAKTLRQVGKSPAKVNPLKQSFSSTKVTSPIESEQKVIELLEAL